MASEEILDSLRAAITLKPPFCTGAVPISSDHATLFYKKGESAHWLDLSQANPEQLQALAEACEPATFGLGQNDVLNEEYRKAGKMDASNFSMRIHMSDLGIVDRIREQLLYAPEDQKYVKAELYKLNVYGKDSFFKSHKDTPRGDTMFASLVVVFPTPHEGGALKLSHDGEEWTFDSAALTRDAPTPSIAYIAFYSDVDHEVTLVTSGHRVTLTYNLFLDSSPSQKIPRSVQAVAPDSNLFRDALLAAFDDPTFLPDGGYLGFGMSFTYPISRVKRYYSNSGGALKGSDAMIFAVLEDLSLSPSMSVVYKGLNHKILVPTDYLTLGSDAYDDIDSVLCEEHYGKVILGLGQDIPSHFNEDLPIARMTWVTPLTTFSNFRSDYTYYGNEASTEHVYGDLCIAVKVGAFGQRDTIADSGSSDEELV
ncbi:hypothetical protein H0H81_009240 [Sphagnurus paluster]|uniref:Fe2OG dioxygenase domain-containing protein n=1 Tax=Sphagnurus paluster TaxID=117069 RepID=A0A9P7GK75_9AGAR|nr:hypothetical protein H0H81_009240 [Sphagnurus paluster]